MQDVRNRIAELARQAVTLEQAKHQFYYEEVRPLTLHWSLPWDGDCSWFVKTVYWQAGCTNDPTGHDWNGWGNSVDLYFRGRHITQGNLLPGDVIVFGLNGDIHAVLCVENGLDPVCASMGQAGDPSLVALSVLEGLGTPTFLRFDTTDAKLPSAPKRNVTVTDLQKNQLVLLKARADAKLALENGWTVFTWDGYKFVAGAGPHPVGTHEYANVHYKTKRP